MQFEVNVVCLLTYLLFLYFAVLVPGVVGVAVNHHIRQVK